MTSPESRISDVEAIVRRQDEWRGRTTINLIASENIMSRRARALMSCDFNHRYAEGHPGARYYEGTRYIDEIETELKARLREIFGCRQVEARTISGTNANEALFAAFLGWNEAAIVNSLPMGGHISHQTLGGLGKFTKNIFHFPRKKDGHRISVRLSKDKIKREKPRLVLFGKSMILFPEPVRELVPVCREVGATILYDGAHVLGLIAGGQFQDPLAEGADILSGSTHKTFFGPQRGVILSNYEDEVWSRIDRAAFPRSTSNHHLFTLPPLLVSTYEMLEFGRAYAKQTIANAKAIGAALDGLGIPVECRQLGYTESHQVAVNVAAFGGGHDVAVRLRENDIITNRNLLPRDPRKRVHNPSGIRIGAQEMTRLGMKEPEMEEIARLIKACIVDGHDVRPEVRRLRARFPDVHYSFDRRVPSGRPQPV
ncbi:MAG: serine hydroxymethyltransferase, partial [Planctomycetota bacterium]